MQLSKITEGFTESVIREMTRICEEAGGINLSQGMPDFSPPQEIKQSAVKAIEGGDNQYPVTFGESDLRETISDKVARYNDIDCDPKTDITVTCGATEAMIATLKAALNPGEEIIVFEPFYENYGPDAILSGAEPRYVTLNPPDWSFSSEELASKFNSNTKAIIINTPNNPTGKVFTKKELNEISELCQKWDCIAITDEVYEHIIYGGSEHLSMATIEGMKDRTVTINSMSKTYSVTGWRIGWAIAPERITNRIRKVHDFLTVGAPKPFQKAGVKALKLPKSYYQQLRERYQKQRDLLFNALIELGFEATKPSGAYYILVQADRIMDRLGVEDDFQLSKKLIEKTGVATVPGSSFYSGNAKGQNQVRFCFSKKEKTLEKVKKRLEKLPP